MKGKTKFLILCMIFVASVASGQTNVVKPATTKPFGNFRPSLFSSTLLVLPNVSSIPANYYSHNLGFFCKKEIKFEAVTGIPLKFRLGSVQACDWQEGKRAGGIIKPN